VSIASLNVAEDFEAWASLAARLRVATVQERRTLLGELGLEATWEAIHEGWARALNEEIAAGRLERPERYLALCATEASAARRGASMTLPGVADDEAGEVLPFVGASTMPPSSGARSSPPSSNEAAAAFFAELRASAPNVMPPPPRRAHTLPVLGEPREPVTERPTPSEPPRSDEAMAVEDRFLADFRASLMPPAPVARPGRQQATTVVAVDAEEHAEASAQVKSLVAGWTGDRLASFLDAVMRARTPAEAVALWRGQGIASHADEDYVRSTFVLRLESDPALAWRWREVATSVRRGER
jgi:hypothetical protein